MNKLAAIVLSALLSLSCFTAFASYHNKGEPGHLIVFLAEYGEVNELAEGKYELLISKQYLDRIMMFTGKYFSIYKNITEDQVKGLLKPKTGKVNVVGLRAAIDVGEDLQTVTLTEVKITDKAVRFIHSARNWPDRQIDGTTAFILYVDKGSKVKGGALWCAVTLTC